ncbi:MAG TPA: ribbon-helix-helix protein, CopG family [Chloroflexi bacterium]|nr:ribbon-helix-helix protein, CopG family [Chloroflexota bacterium]
MTVDVMTLVVSVPAPLHKRLQKTAETREETLSALVRQALAEYLARAESEADDAQFAVAVLNRIAEGSPTYTHETVWDTPVKEQRRTIVLDDYAIPQQGAFEIHTTVQIDVSADQAQRLARRFLMNEISHLLVADPPDLVVGAQTRWRVPVWIGFPGGGRHDVGVIEVDAQTGAFVDQAAHIAEISARAAVAADNLPPFAPRTDVPATSRTANLPEYQPTGD